MINSQMAEAIKVIAPIWVNSIPGGGLLAITDTKEIIWKAASDVFDVPSIHAGTTVRVGGGPYQAMQQKRQTEEKVARAVYGMRLVMTSVPIIDDGEVTGSFIVVMPRLHPIARAFNDFAPMMANMFHEGAFLYMSDLEKIAYRQGSNRFDIPQWQAGDKISEDTVARRVIRSKQMIAEELDAGKYGVPVRIVTFPCFDEDDPTAVVATFGLILPRETAANLRDMSNNLSRGLEEVSSVIQELAASASEVTINEQQLNGNIMDIFKLSEEINGVLGFIKQIADETKMLGLNAAIEAARAGDVGRGFGVVAEEIRKLSDESKSTVGKIKGLTDNIKQKVDETMKNSEVTLRSSEEQAAASQEMSASIEEITSMSEQLEKIAKAM
ncbi:MAG TPA: methyl-accepting chemotaxis protein [Syntrophomonadaceae bacterium]|nr:methyl-accepting chemotaxis protein [Syntrophomonadaceae bacterium]